MNELDELSLQRGRGKKVDANFSFKHPTLGEVCDYVEDNGIDYYSALSMLITNSLDYADILWFENKVWYEDIKNEWEFFLQRLFSLSGKSTLKFVVPNEEKAVEAEAQVVDKNTQSILNFFLGTTGKWAFWEKKEENNAQIYLINIADGEHFSENCVKFTEYYYYMLVDWLKCIHSVRNEYLFTKGGSRAAKEYMLKYDYKKRKKKQKQSPVTIGSINSAIIAKGVALSTWDLPIYLFYELYHRLIKINEYNNTMSALYAGAIDTKKNPINWEKINWSSVIEK